MNSKYNYDTLSEAINGLKSRGFQYDFNLESNQIVCPEIDRCFIPNEFEVLELYRFEGDSDPADNAILYAIDAGEGVKGLLVDAYGSYAGNVSQEMLDKLKVNY